MSEKVYWVGDIPDCQLCEAKAINMPEFVDGATLMGPWAIMCNRCHITYGVGLGTGRGQRYKRQKDGSWLKILG